MIDTRIVTFSIIKRLTTILQSVVTYNYFLLSSDKKFIYELFIYTTRTTRYIFIHKKSILKCTNDKSFLCTFTAVLKNLNKMK